MVSHHREGNGAEFQDVPALAPGVRGSIGKAIFLGSENVDIEDTRAPTSDGQH